MTAPDWAERKVREIQDAWLLGIDLAGSPTLFARIASALVEARNRGALEEHEDWAVREAAICPEDFGFDEVILSLNEKLRVAVEALEFYETYVPTSRAITPDSAAYEREFGIGKRASEALAEIRGNK